MSELEKVLRAVEAGFTQVNSRLDKIENRISTVEEATGTILETVTRMELNQPEDIEGVLKHVQSNNRYLEKKFVEMDKRLVELEDRLQN
ncbi:hypothetical protein [Priestia megaterium]|uniref:hypothetical protein n=1 Tax=Priestia megaterium TaxID=1404 RepID=UPI00366DEB32